MSSTFMDFRPEREVLRREVFSRLRKLCQRYGARFQAVDLRWGISEAASLDQRTVDICLDELRRCQDISPVPNFVLLIGDRYGWQPLPGRIERAEFDRVLEGLRSGRAPRSQIARLASWYRLDENDVPPTLHLRPRAGRFVTREAWGDVERDLLGLLRRGAREAGVQGEALEKYYLSATAQEVKSGVFRPPLLVPDVRTHVFAFSREFESRPSSMRGDASIYFDVDEHGALDHDRRERLLRMRADLGARLGTNLKGTTVRWRDRNPRAGFLRRLAGEAYRSLAAVIEPDLQRLNLTSQDQAEVERHRDFQQGRARDFFGRQAEVEALTAHSARTCGLPLLVVGEGGSGKSSLLAAAAECLGRDSTCRVLARFVGVTGASCQFASLVRGLGAEVQHDGLLAVPAPRSLDPQAWTAWFHRLSDRVEPSHRLVLVLDAVDQLSAEDQRRLLEWLPTPLPDRIWMVLSATPGAAAASLVRRLGDSNVMRLPRLGVCDGQSIVLRWLALARRTLQPFQLDALLAGFEASGSPLYLRLAFEDAVTWRSDQRVSLPTTLPGIVQRKLRRMERPDQHGEILPRLALSYLAVSRNGLSETELLDILSRDGEVLADFRRRSPESEAVDELPFVVWARLQGDLGAYLTERVNDRSLLYDYYHRIVEESVRRRYLGVEAQVQSLHRRLAAYFGGIPLWHGSRGARRPNLRVLSETSFHLAGASDHEGLFALLSDEAYRDVKFAAGEKYAWLDELDACYGLLPSTSARVALLERVVLHLEDLGGVVNPTLPLEDVHGYFAYRPNCRFYPALVSYGAKTRASVGARSEGREELRLGFVAREANRLRRAGEFKRAEEMLAKVVRGLEARPALGAERSRAEYDLGYLHYLRGSYEASLGYLDASAASAGRVGNRVGRWISRIVGGYVRVVAALGSERFGRAARRFARLLAGAEPCFKALADTDTTAERWVRNVRAHRFDHAFLLGDADCARAAFRAIESDRFLLRFGGEEALAKFRGRLALLEGRAEEACAELGRFVPTTSDVAACQSLRRREALARDLLDYGRALERSGRAAAARCTWELALSLPDDAGNLPWKAQVRTELGRLA